MGGPLEGGVRLLDGSSQIGSGSRAEEAQRKRQRGGTILTPAG